MNVLRTNADLLLELQHLADRIRRCPKDSTEWHDIAASLLRACDYATKCRAMRERFEEEQS